MRQRGFQIALLVLGLVGFATSASAQQFINDGDLDGDGVAPNEVFSFGFAPGDDYDCSDDANDPIILNEVVFVRDADVEIQPGCIIRGQPRDGAVAGGAATAPGALVFTRGAKIRAIGAPNSPIIFTTAATDNNNDGIPDVDPGDGFLDQYNAGDDFIDDDPLGAPLAPLDQAGESTISLWGGMVLLGRAPTNLANNAPDPCGGVGEPPCNPYGVGLIEGLLIPNFPIADAQYGGVDPHDSSGTLNFVSVRHAGDTLIEANELNCISLGAVGDGTEISHVECYVNYDDGFEFFGGTADADHLVAHGIGDDSFDVDQGYTGVMQFLFAVLPHYQENDGDSIGDESGDRVCECDGDDSGNSNFRIDTTDADTDLTCWPLSHPRLANVTALGGGGDLGSATVQAPAQTGFHLRNGFAGRIINAAVVNLFDDIGGPMANTGLGVSIDSGVFDSDCTDTTTYVASGEVSVQTSTFQDVRAPVAPGDQDEIDTLANGDDRCEDDGAPAGCANFTNPAGGFFGFQMVQENQAYDPQGGACPGVLCGKLHAGLMTGGPAGALLDPRINSIGAASGGATPLSGRGFVSTGEFRGAFGAGPNWTTGQAQGDPNPAPGWTSLSNGGLIAP